MTTGPIILEIGAKPIQSKTRRPFPDTVDGIHVFNDKLEFVSSGQLFFAATHYAGTQKMTRASADALRVVNPDFVILHYRLGYGLGFRQTLVNCEPLGDWLEIIEGDWIQEWPGDDVVQESWFYVYYNQRVFNCNWGWYVMDIRNDSWRNWWISQVLTQLENNDNDGLFADSFKVPNFLGADAFQPDLHDVDSLLEKEWTFHLNNLIDYITQKFAGRYYLIPNVAGWVTNRNAVDYSRADGVMIEGFGYDVWEKYGEQDWLLQLNRALKLINQDKILIAQSYNLDSIDIRLFSLASYLLIKGNRTYINLELCKEPEWWPEYDLPIGEPLSQKPDSMGSLYNSDWGVYTREYQNGLVLVNAGEDRRTIQLDKEYNLALPVGGGTVPSNGLLPKEWSINYPIVSSISLDEGQAVILIDKLNTTLTTMFSSITYINTTTGTRTSTAAKAPNQ